MIYIMICPRCLYWLWSNGRLPPLLAVVLRFEFESRLVYRDYARCFFFLSLVPSPNVRERELAKIRSQSTSSGRAYCSTMWATKNETKYWGEKERQLRSRLVQQATGGNASHGFSWIINYWRIKIYSIPTRFSGVYVYIIIRCFFVVAGDRQLKKMGLFAFCRRLVLLCLLIPTTSC